MRIWYLRPTLRVCFRKGLKNRFYVFGVVIVVIVIILLIRRNTTTSDTPQLTTKLRDESSKTVLLWNDFFDTKHFGVPLGSKAFSGCKVKNCELWDRLDSEPDLPHDNYDALIFHGIDTGISSISDLPLVRSPKQRYIFLLQESPIMRPYFYNLKNFFNWTATYRRDSDFYMPYMKVARPSKPTNSGGHLKVWREPTYLNKIHVPESFSNKSKMVVWFVSNTNTQSKRDHYANDLANYISVDIYGKGRRLSCSRYDNTCDVMLDTIYRFYLAFENSLCDDYVTEKLQRALDHYIVPVVYGGADYTAFAPPLSYIDVKDYANPKELARYLHYLAEHPKEYQKYFWWKEFYRMDGTNFWCDLCKKLHDPEEPNKVYADMNFWWNYPGVCWTPREHFSGGF